jgi:hypothetical protein
MGEVNGMASLKACICSSHGCNCAKTGCSFLVAVVSGTSSILSKAKSTSSSRASSQEKSSAASARTSAVSIGSSCVGSASEIWKAPSPGRRGFGWALLPRAALGFDLDRDGFTGSRFLVVSLNFWRWPITTLAGWGVCSSMPGTEFSSICCRKLRITCVRMRVRVPRSWRWRWPSTKTKSAVPCWAGGEGFLGRPSWRGRAGRDVRGEDVPLRFSVLAWDISRRILRVW